MKFVNSLGRRRFLFLLALVLACGGLAGIWQSSAFQRTKQPTQRLTANEMKAASRARMQRGVGGQVRFASPGDSEATVKTSVDSVAKFIYERSNLYMSAATKNRLVKAEQDALNGNGHRISVADLTETLTTITANRLSTLKDTEIERAVDTFRPTPEGMITARSNGKWGYLTRADFIRQVKAGRGWSLRGDAAVKTALRSMIDEEVRDRVTSLVATLPERFGNVTREGATPTQALLISYAVAADDSLESSQSDLRTQFIQQRMAQRQTRPEKAQHDPGKAYGVKGFMYSSPVDLFFDKSMITQLLTRAEGGRD
ncbi:MAG: hypothetical protein WCF57_23150 [Pyrinomonadaceae bacterium]